MPQTDPLPHHRGAHTTEVLTPTRCSPTLPHLPGNMHAPVAAQTCFMDPTLASHTCTQTRVSRAHQVKVDDGGRLRVQVRHATRRLHRDHAPLPKRRAPLGRAQLPAEASAAHVIRHDARNHHRVALLATAGRGADLGRAAGAAAAAAATAAVRRRVDPGVGRVDPGVGRVDPGVGRGCGAGARHGTGDDAVHADDVGVVELGEHLGLLRWWW
eukprot:205269-Chlamydomonas_euryale.AAC.1